MFKGLDVGGSCFRDKRHLDFFSFSVTGSGAGVLGAAAAGGAVGDSKLSEPSLNELCKEVGGDILVFRPNPPLLGWRVWDGGCGAFGVDSEGVTDPSIWPVASRFFGLWGIVSRGLVASALGDTA